jgi:hypothetical protein
MFGQIKRGEVSIPHRKPPEREIGSGMPIAIELRRAADDGANPSQLE